MWNRVFLLASGFAFGWTLVSYLTVPLAQARERLIQLILSLAAGLAIIGLMAFSSPPTGLVGGVVFTLSALVAYAGNARQINKAEHPAPLDRPERPLEQRDPRLAVVLVAEGEPVAYDGPKPWARRLEELAALGERVPHWFMRPFTYARIRATYRAMGGRNPFNDAIAHLAKRLEGQLGSGYFVQDAYLAATPSLAEVLARLVEQGFVRTALLPIGLERGWQAALPAEVARSRVLEVGVQVTHIAPLESATWVSGSRVERLRRLMWGLPVLPPSEPGEEVVEQLRKRALAITSSQSLDKM